jgi:hypothetical protein
MDDETWDALEAQLGFALQERDRDPGDYLVAIDRDAGEVVLRTGEGVPGSRLTFSMEEEDFDRTVPRIPREMVDAALGPE